MTSSAPTAGLCSESGGRDESDAIGRRVECRALTPRPLRLRLADDQHHTLAQADAGTLPTSQWLEGDKHAVTITAAFPTIAGDSSKAVLRLSLHDPATGRVVKLPLSKRTHDEFCEIGEVEVLR